MEYWTCYQENHPSRGAADVEAWCRMNGVRKWRRASFQRIVAMLEGEASAAIMQRGAR